jgi:hypothetical protein
LHWLDLYAIKNLSVVIERHLTVLLIILSRHI